MVRFLHTSDWQLGMHRRHLAGEARGAFAAARREVVGRLVALAATEGCAFVVVAGDVFDDNQVERSTVVQALDTLAAARMPVYLLPGNHDPLDGASVYSSPTFRAACPPHVHVLTEGAVFEPRPGVFVVGAPWKSKHPGRDLVEEALSAQPVLPPGQVRILVAHGAVDEGHPSPGHPEQIRVVVAERALAERRVDYLALGDCHSMRNVGSTGAIWYCGSPEPTAHREPDPGRVLVVDVEDGAVEVTPHRVGVWEFATLEATVRGSEDVSALQRRLRAFPDRCRIVLQLELSGTLRLTEFQRLTEVVEQERSGFAAVRPECPVAAVRVVTSDADFDRLDLGGYAAAALAALRNAAEVGDEEAAGALMVLLSLTKSEVDS